MRIRPGVLVGIISAFIFGFQNLAVGQSFDLLYQKDAFLPEKFGSSVAGAGDVNGDGKADFIIGAPYSSPDGRTYAGSAYVYSGADGSLLYQKDGAANFDYFGISVAGAGDVDANGKADFIIGAFYADTGGVINVGSAYIYSGADGSLLYRKDGAAAFDWLGMRVAGAGDVNGDGKADFIIGAIQTDPGGFTDAGSAYLYSGLDGSLLYQKDGAAAGDRLGISVASVGDINGDGKADFIVGADNTDPGGIDYAGSAYVYSGANGSLLYQKDGAARADYFGSSVAGAGDVNGDGIADFIIGAVLASPGGRSWAGSAFVYSGATGALLYQKDGAVAQDGLGNSVAGAGDVNGDGKADFIIGALYADPSGRFEAGSVYLYSGADGTLLSQKDGAVSGDNLGYSVASAGDVNGDGKADFIIGAPNASSAYVYGFTCAAAKGDMNASGGLSPADVVLMLNCVYLGTGDCGSCFADVNCDGVLRPADVVLELLAVFVNQPFPCL